ncbi:unnamed protein product [Prunus armeniaca]
MVTTLLVGITKLVPCFLVAIPSPESLSRGSASFSHLSSCKPRRSKTMAEKAVDLPEECWELIIKLLDHPSHFNSLSQVCKQFLSITNRLLLSLKLSDPTVQALLPRLLQRFRRIKQIELTGFQGDMNSILHQIAQSGLNLESLNVSKQPTLPVVGLRALGSKMMDLKSLNCSKMRCFGDSDLNVIAESFPCLEELDISYHADDSTIGSKPISDLGIFSLSLKLKSLRKINLSAFKVPFLSSKALWAIALSDSDISDEFLYAVAEARFPLKKLTLSRCANYSFSGISVLLNEYQSLEYLNLEAAYFLRDEDIAELSRFLHSIYHINLSHCYGLTCITFYTLIKNCMILDELEMVATSIGEENIETDFKASHGIKALNLANSSLGNNFITSFASICPKLELLNLSKCKGITEEGIVEVLKRCSEIRQLEVNHIQGMRNSFLHLEFELPKLKVLSLMFSGIDDDALAMIGKRCCRLLKLDLAGCLSLTSKGVKEVVENCKELKEINLKWCNKFSADIVPWMVFSRPSLKKIVLPSRLVLTERQRNLFLRHGCVVYDGGAFE